MYTFRKIKLAGWDKPQWYLLATSITDVLDHFNTVCKREIADGCKEYVEESIITKNGDIWHPHPDTPWGVGVDVLANTLNIPWVEAAVRLENETLQDRLNTYRDNKCVHLYLADNLTYFGEYDGMDIEVLEEMYMQELEYPITHVFTYDDIRTMKWDIPGMHIRGTHYYAKVGKYDVIGPDGSMKWDTESEAMRAGMWWVDEYNRKAAMDFYYIHGKKYKDGEPLE